MAIVGDAGASDIYVLLLRSTELSGHRVGWAVVTGEIASVGSGAA